MVSIKYLWGVGEFGRTKSMPRGTFTSSRDVPTALAAAITTITRIMLDNRLSIPQVPVSRAFTFRARPPLPNDSEKKLERKLNQAGARSRGRAGYYSEVCIIRCAAGCARWRELC